MNDVPLAVISDLIELGQCDDANANLRDKILARLKQFERVNWLGRNVWSPIMESLDEARSRNLVRGLALGELLLNWSGGSAASVIWAFQVFQRRFANGSEELADWILRRSENPYAPFGTMRAGVRSISEYRSYLAAKTQHRKDGEQAQERRKILKQVKLAVRRRLAAERLVLQDAHRRARQDLVDEVHRLPVKQRLEHIAWDDFHSLVFYPSSFADVTREQLAELDMDTRQRLLDKMAARHKGAWLRASKRLR
jgi:hypothetical protein